MSDDKAAILSKILAHKRDEVEQLRVAELRSWAREQEPPRGFASALAARAARGRPAVIAELKRASPSAGVLREDFDPLAIARGYAAAGAACLSVLTDRRFFQGSGVLLDLIRRHCPLPLLRKDFIIDARQVHESRALGADCILLIVAALAQPQLAELFELAREYDMDVLVEVHDEEELERALELGDALRLVGVNNRNLRTFEVSLDTTRRLAANTPDDKLLVSESGIKTANDIAELRAAGARAFLLGEALMTAPDPGERLRALLAEA